jgi:hypothetical protein
MEVIIKKTYSTWILMDDPENFMDIVYNVFYNIY